jgi:hypothetical protein
VAEREDTDELRGIVTTDLPQALVFSDARPAVTYSVEGRLPGVVRPTIAREPMTASPTCTSS